jgi:hypothetical protein
MPLNAGGSLEHPRADHVFLGRPRRVSPGLDCGTSNNSGTCTPSALVSFTIVASVRFSSPFSIRLIHWTVAWTNEASCCWVRPLSRLISAILRPTFRASSSASWAATRQGRRIWVAK